MEEISWKDFEKIEIRVGTIIEVRDFPEARKPAYKVKIDFGKLGVRSSSAQITRLYSKKDLENSQVIAVTNFPPKKIAGFNSECLILGIYQTREDVILLQPERPVENGKKIG